MKILLKRTILPIIVTLILILTLIPESIFALTGAITITPANGPVGTVVTLIGTGFTASSNYTAKIDTITVKTGAISAGGALSSTTFIVPEMPAGVHSVAVITSSGDTSNAISFTVTPDIIISAVSGNVGDSIGVSGNGFKASSTIGIYVDGISAATVTTDVNGTFFINLVVPRRNYGNHIITATDASANSVSETFTVNSTLAINPTSGAVGLQVTLTGRGFSSNSSTKILLDGTSVVTTTSDADGSFVINYAIPTRPGGVHSISAVDASSHTAAVDFNVTPAFTLNPASIVSGSQVNVNGLGFSAGSTVSVYIDGTVITTNAGSTDSSGSFALSNVLIPALPGGNHEFLIRDTAGKSVSIIFGVTPKIDATIASAASGATVQVIGKGFGANKNIALNFDGVRLSVPTSTAITDSTGSFSTSFVVPTSSGGLHVITVGDGTFTANQDFTVTANSSLNSTSGSAGTTTVLSGNGFGSKANVQIKFDGNLVATATADVNGTFSYNLVIPEASTGVHNITASDGTRNIAYSFNISARTLINPVNGNVGGNINISGTGFSANTKVTVSYDATEIATATTNDKGSFSVDIIAPISHGGEHAIKVSNGNSLVTSTFLMDTTAPITPTLLTPLNDTKVKSDPSFAWQEVRDPSGVTYILQISRDVNFGVVLLEKSGLTSPVYQLLTTERLKTVSKQSPYYWRVRAVDAASNQSAWTTPSKFYVGLFIPSYVIYIVFSIGIIVAGFVGYWVGARNRKVKSKPDQPKVE